MTSLTTIETADQAEFFLETLLKTARRNFTTDGYLTPVAILLTKQSPSGEGRLGYHVFPAAEAFESTKNKNAFLAMIKDMSHQYDGYCFFLISEAWVVKGDPKAINGSLEHHPDRQEVVMAHFEHAAIGTRFYIADISQENEQKQLHEFSHFPAVNGRFVGILSEALLN